MSDAELPPIQPTTEQNRRLVHELREVVEFLALSMSMEEQGQAAPSLADRPLCHGPLFMLLGVMIRVVNGQFRYGEELRETTAALHGVENALHLAAEREALLALQAMEQGAGPPIPPGGAWLN